MPRRCCSVSAIAVAGAEAIEWTVHRDERSLEGGDGRPELLRVDRRAWSRTRAEERHVLGNRLQPRHDVVDRVGFGVRIAAHLFLGLERLERL